MINEVRKTGASNAILGCLGISAPAVRGRGEPSAYAPIPAHNSGFTLRSPCGLLALRADPGAAGNPPMAPPSVEGDVKRHGRTS